LSHTHVYNSFLDFERIYYKYSAMSNSDRKQPFENFKNFTKVSNTKFSLPISSCDYIGSWREGERSDNRPKLSLDARSWTYSERPCG